MYKIRYISFCLFLIAGAAVLGACSEDKRSDKHPQRLVDYSFYRFIDHVEEAVEVPQLPQNINDNIVKITQTIIKGIPRKPVDDKMKRIDIDFGATGGIGSVRKFEIQVPEAGKSTDTGLASIKIKFKAEGDIAGVVFRYSEKGFYFCGLHSGPKGSLFLVRFQNDRFMFLDFTAFPVALEQENDITVLYHGHFFEIVHNNRIFRIAYDSEQPFPGKVGIFSSDSTDAQAYDLTAVYAIEKRFQNILAENTGWEQFLFYRHYRFNPEVNSKWRDFSLKAGLDGETRPSFFLFPGGGIKYRIKVPPSGRLDFGLGIPTELARNKKITFTVNWEVEKQPVQELARVELGPENSGRWIDRVVDLSTMAGQEGIISFQALLSQPGPFVPTALLLSNPLLRSAAPPDKPSIILYVVDSLREDYLGIYGNKENISPNIDRWASRAITFERAFAQATWSKPSVVSLFLSQYPIVHTILRFTDKALPRYITLAKQLAADGYITAGFSENPLTGAGSGVDYGFDHLFSHMDLARMGQFMSQKDKYPFFLFIQTSEPNSPYTPPEDIRKKYSSLTSGKIKSMNDLLSKFQNLSRLNFERRLADKTFDNSREQTKILDKIRSHTEDYKNLYKAEVAAADRKFGEFLQTFEKSADKENTVLAFLSPNGQEFFEHDTILAGNSLYRESIHVPLIVSWPKRWKGNRRIPHPVELIDIFPSLLEMVGRKKSLAIQGTSFVNLLDGLTINKDIYSCRIDMERFYKPYAERRGSFNVSLIRWPYKIIYNQAPDTVEIFDLSKDPAERNNIAEKNAELKDKLKGDLIQWISMQNSLRLTLDIKKDKIMIDPIMQKKLRNAGYLN